jgi:hypothetical protein
MKALANHRLNAVMTRMQTRNSSSTAPNQGIFPKQISLPAVSLAVACTALCFQVTVLFPWHEELSHQFTQLEVRFLDLFFIQYFDIPVV